MCREYPLSISGQAQKRLTSSSSRTVTFSYRESGTGQECRCTLAAEEFLRRFLQHVLPKGFHRVRHSGWLSPAAKVTFTRIAALLGAPEAAILPGPRHPFAPLCLYCAKPLRHVLHIPRAAP